jgi:hypothetical protein
MGLLRFAPIILAAIAASGCFQSTTLIRVNADGSGTLEQTTLMTQAGLRTLRQVWAMSASDGSEPTELFSTAQARQFAETMGPGVTLVSSTPIKNADGEGSRAVVAFRDISQLRARRDRSTDADALEPSRLEPPQIHFAVTHEPNGHAILHITMPPPAKTAPTGATAPEGSGSRPQSRMPAEQLAMVRQLFAGARVAVAIEPAGELVKTTCPFVDGNTVTLVDVAFDQVFANEMAFVRLQSARTIDEARAAVKQVPGLKVHLEPEVTIEFAPDQSRRDQPRP